MSTNSSGDSALHPTSATQYVSQISVRRGIAVVAVVALLLAGYALHTANTQAAVSTVVINAASQELSWNEGETVIFQLALINHDTEWTSQTIRLYTNWLSGGGPAGDGVWPWNFTQQCGDPLVPVFDPNGDLVPNGIIVPAGQVVEFFFAVDIPDDTAGQTEQVVVYGIDNYGSYSGNVTYKPDGTSLLLTIHSVSFFGVRMGAEPVSVEGNTLVYNDEPTLWEYNVRNTGTETDEFNVYPELPGVGWEIDMGLEGPLYLPGKSNDAANHRADKVMTLTPAADARPGSYDIIIHADSATGKASSDYAVFTVTIPAPDLHFTDLSFSHFAAWIDGSGEAQTVTLYATVTNSGGSYDINGRPVEHIDVWITVDGTTLDGIHYIDSLEHKEEVTITLTFTPTRDGELPVVAMVDLWNNQDGGDPADVNILESNEGNNTYNETFRVVKVRLSSPSFYVGFLMLMGAVAAVVTVSALYRRRSEEEEV